MPKLKLQVAHQVSDRVRLKIPSAKGNPALSQEIGDAFSRIPGIGHITVNPVNGSVVLHYDPEFHDAVHSSLQRHTGRVWRNGQRPPDTEIDTLARKIEDEAEFLAQHSKSAKAVVDFCKSSTARSRSQRTTMSICRSFLRSASSASRFSSSARARRPRSGSRSASSR